MDTGIQQYISAQLPVDSQICDALRTILDRELPMAQSKIWHAHPVWFLDGNPVAGFSKQKAGIRLMFWSGADFKEPGLSILGARFKDASIFYKSYEELVETDVIRWARKAQEIQWDYRNLVKRRGILEKLK